jgi:hypothetical protein
LNGRVRDERSHIEQFGLLTMLGNTVPYVPVEHARDREHCCHGAIAAPARIRRLHVGRRAAGLQPKRSRPLVVRVDDGFDADRVA